ncbi:hypothetical protein [Candidatus Leptofilum sp.]|uniref:hypothetical protein n=1 Tax=Candidatus Leptofilum sp. TaxID=3241576 RepID=UPI003B5B6689
MSDYDYETIIKERCADLELVMGKVLQDAMVNVVDPEINVVYLKTEESWFEIHGEFGSEILGIHKIASEVLEKEEIGLRTSHIPRLDQFIGLTIARARQIGEAWNGHGFEFSFKELADKTLIVQSIYTGTEPKDFYDCLRIGVGDYVHRIDISEM